MIRILIYGLVPLGLLLLIFSQPSWRKHGRPMAVERGREPIELPTSEVKINGRTPIEHFLALAARRNEDQALATIRENWSPGDAPLLLEAAVFSRDSYITAMSFMILSQKTGQPRKKSANEWYRWIWSQEFTPHPDYAKFKSRLYRQIDPRFAEYFDNRFPSTIKLEEVRWGGVFRDGIPPLKNPKTLRAQQADYLADSDIVFGVEFNGHARAYPKRILAWHEMVKDIVGGKSINGVYCTLCGSMIIYKTEFNDTQYELGTSGFLYRSNKLMYDHATRSMWSTLKGKPVIGPLVGKGIKLEPLYVVTTTWGKWKADHPNTDVLSLDTGHRRDYGEGVAYREYFATDQLMFPVPNRDDRLKNKDEVLTIRTDDTDPLAISTEFLSRHPVYQDRIGDQMFVVLTDPSGGNRVYQSEIKKFDQWLDNQTVSDTDGNRWRVTEDALVLLGNDDDEVRLKRLPAHRAFWFGWVSAFEKTRLVK